MQHRSRVAHWRHLQESNARQRYVCERLLDTTCCQYQCRLPAVVCLGGCTSKCRNRRVQRAVLLPIPWLRVRATDRAAAEHAMLHTLVR
jgi:hypothetical protein